MFRVESIDPRGSMIHNSSARTKGEEQRGMKMGEEWVARQSAVCIGQIEVRQRA